MIYKNLLLEMNEQRMKPSQLHRKLVDNGCKISYTTLSRYLKGESQIPFLIAGEISEIMGKRVDYLFKLKEEQ